MFRIIGIFAHLFTQTEIGDFDLSTTCPRAQEDIRRFQVEMNHRRFDTRIEIPKGTDSLHHHRTSFFLWNDFVLFQEEIDVVALDVFQNRAESMDEQTSIAKKIRRGSLTNQYRFRTRRTIEQSEDDPMFSECHIPVVRV